MPKFKKLFLLFLIASILFPNLVSAQEERRDLNVTATVPADPSDFNVQMVQLTSGDDFPQNTNIEYEITYGSELNTQVNFTLEAQWYDGETEDQSTIVSVVDYLSGSATNAYGGAVPVIDTVNKKITWEITNFPPSTSQTVRFKLRTNANYQGSQIVTFKVAGRIDGPGFVTPDSNAFSTYLYSASPTPTPSPTASNPSPGPTSSPTSSPLPSNPEIQIIQIRTISDNSAQIYIQTLPATKSVIKYGASIKSLNKSVSSSTFTTDQFLTLTGLLADTQYYFQVTSTTSAGKQITSDIYTFKTAINSEIPTVNLDSFVATSNETILTLLGDSGSEAQLKNNYIVIPTGTVFQFKFALTAPSGAKVQAVIRKSDVLGANTFVKQQEASTEIVNLIEIEPGVYAGNLQTSNKSGNYEIYARITDKNGNIIEQKIANLRVIKKFTAQNKTNGKPIEGARVLFYIFNESTGKYQVIPASALSEGNPVYTDKSGQVNTVLPQAKYKVEVSRLGFKDQTVKFTIGIKSGQDFPLIQMEKEGFNLISTIKYYLKTTNDIFLFNTQIYAQILTGSARFFDLVAFVILLSLVLLALFAFSRKNHMPVTSFKSYFFYLKDKNARNERYIHGVVYDEHDMPISQANVYLTNEVDEAIISHTKTNKNGEFFFKKGKDKYLIMVMKKGFKSTNLVKYEERDHVKFKISLEQEGGVREIAHNFSHIIETFLGMGFEVILIASLLFEVLFLNTFGILKTLPFLAISGFNLLLWTLHVKHKHWEN